MNDHLKNLLELNLSKASKKSTVVLAVADPLLGKSIRDVFDFGIDASEIAQDLIRGIRLHASKLLKGLQTDDLTKAQLGLGHSYSRSKLKFNVNRIDNMIIQAIALLDQLDKDVNLFSMRIREWYGYHFPELIRLVPDNHQYARVAKFIGDKDSLDEDKLPDLAALLDDDTTVAQNILDAARGSMGSGLSDIDMLNISSFATRVVSLSDYRKSLVSYLAEKMNSVAPSLTALLGERVGARLISHAGSLTNLSKYPASTVQILGAEKALFRALKTKGNTPKVRLTSSPHPYPSSQTWGHSMVSFTIQPLSVARVPNTKVVSLDSSPTNVQLHLVSIVILVLGLFSLLTMGACTDIALITENPTAKFGEALRAQVEERLNFFETGAPPSKNADAIRRVLEDLALDEQEDDNNMEVDGPALTTLEATPAKPKKDKKKRKRDDMDVDEEIEEHSSKKVKLTKEEKKALKKALKKAMKEKAKSEAATVVSIFAFFQLTRGLRDS